jgi:hypothetical protein
MPDPIHSTAEYPVLDLGSMTHSVSIQFQISKKNSYSPNGSSTNTLHQMHCLVYVLGEHRSRETIFRVVCPLNDLIELLESQYLLYWSKDLQKIITYFILDSGNKNSIPLYLNIRSSRIKTTNYNSSDEKEANIV